MSRSASLSPAGYLTVLWDSGGALRLPPVTPRTALSPLRASTTTTLPFPVQIRMFGLLDSGSTRLFLDPSSPCGLVDQGSFPSTSFILIADDVGHRRTLFRGSGGLAWIDLLHLGRGTKEAWRKSVATPALTALPRLSPPCGLVSVARQASPTASRHFGEPKAATSTTPAEARPGEGAPPWQARAADAA